MDSKLTVDEMWYVTTFEDTTGASVKDCIKNSDEIIFVVKKGDMGLAIGKNGANINRAREKLGKKIEVIEHSDDPVEFVKRLFHSLRVEDGQMAGENDKVIRVSIDERDKKMAIGLKGKKLSKVKMLAKRFHGIEDVIID
ncbi:NusA-like transcription termination signal-binding factor [archaeon]|nr:NusA-like transcription termination signal-binding factor [archaeon]